MLRTIQKLDPDDNYKSACIPDKKLLSAGGAPLFETIQAP
jgi:hypothetical protein